MSEAWALLGLFTALCAVVVVLSRLRPAGTPLWHLVGLAAGVLVLLVNGPADLAQVLAVLVELRG
ncbi:hypothetical protein [Nocardioides sp.]|uniref:hypothetical protein n=1 Tax=Nocardioides sp. TaxID=35761 RepID=UPI0019AD065C|nr:hypothetical protein [Nocardioides sp.]MBC7279217.1 hypothetical protein [Nocardioides sp.]